MFVEVQGTYLRYNKNGVISIDFYLIHKPTQNPRNLVFSRLNHL